MSILPIVQSLYWWIFPYFNISGRPHASFAQQPNRKAQELEPKKRMGLRNQSPVQLRKPSQKKRCNWKNSWKMLR